MITKQLFDSNLASFIKFNIGDKVVITCLEPPPHCDMQEIGIVSQFGYNCTDELIIGVQIISNYEKTPQIRWFHPNNKLYIITALHFKQS
jgi:hypothetical protein